MARDFIYTFTNGNAPAQDVEYGFYRLSVNSVSGYSDANINPKFIDVDSSFTNSINMNLTATGSATILVKNSLDNVITSGVTFERFISLSDPSGYYPTWDTVDTSQYLSGIYKLNYLPYDTVNAINVYFKISAPGCETTDLTIPMNMKDVINITVTLPLI